MNVWVHQVLLLMLLLGQGLGLLPSMPSISSAFGSNPAVGWDAHSLWIHGQRVFIQSGEFHPWRLPVVSQWADIIQKIAAAGLNTVSIYVHWGLVNPIPGHTDWTGFRSLQPIFDAARQAGLWVIVRPGPYINAETTAGGIPGWVTTLPGHLRTNSTVFTEAWQQYWLELVQLIKPNQVGLPGGTVIAVQIENEYLSDAHSVQGQPLGKDGYMQNLADTLRDQGIFVPLTFNDAGMKRNFVRGQGSTDIYGFDSYPQDFDCSTPEVWRPVTEHYAAYQDSLQLNTPSFIPEFQGGAFDPWGGSGYKNCRKLTGVDFESVFYLNNLAANLKMINYYMIFGGTSWGYLPFPGVYTSYDYGAAISESRSLNEKYVELKRQSLFLRSSKGFYQTDIIGNSSSNPNYLDGVSTQKVFVTELRNPSSGAGFYIVRASNSTSKESLAFRLKVSTSKGTVALPPITLQPRRSKLLVTDYRTSPKDNSLESSWSIEILYATSNVLLSAHIGGVEVLYLFSDNSTTLDTLAKVHEVGVIKIPGSKRAQVLHHSLGRYTARRSLNIVDDEEYNGYQRISWEASQSSGITAITTFRATVILSDEKTAGAAWNPIVLTDSGARVRETSILVWGPWLLRNASISASPTGKTLSLWGDMETHASQEVVIYAGRLKFSGLAWNGKSVTIQSHSSSPGFISFLHSPACCTISMNGIPPDHLQNATSTRLDFGNLNWTYRDSLPEIGAEYSDEDWVPARNESSSNPFKKLYGKYYLYSCDYGFCNGAAIWRGHFKHNCNPAGPSQLRLAAEHLEQLGLKLTVSGGKSFVAAVWLNGVFLGTVPATDSQQSDRTARPQSATRVFDFLQDALRPCGQNILTVVQDNMGMDQTEHGFSDTVKHPRGILGYELKGPNGHDVFDDISWKVQGQLGGFQWLADPARGILNENGLFALRSGWHLPMYDLWNTTDWTPSSPIHEGLERAGIGFYHTSFELKFSRGFDIMVSFEFEAQQQLKQSYRVEFWVNGWHMGRMVSDLGPQTKFPVHEGILNYQGQNEFGMTLWALDQRGAKVPGLSLVIDQVLEGGVGEIEKTTPMYNPFTRGMS